MPVPAGVCRGGCPWECRDSRSRTLLGSSHVGGPRLFVLPGAAASVAPLLEGPGGMQLAEERCHLQSQAAQPASSVPEGEFGVETP